MVSREVVVNIPTLEDGKRPALLVQMANRFESGIRFECEGNKVINAKSIMGMMTINLTKGQKIVVLASGSDEQAAVDELAKYLEGKQ